MAFMSQQKKQSIAQNLKKALGTNAKTRGFKYSLGVRNHSTIVMRIPSGTIDFLGDYMRTVDTSSDIRDRWVHEPLTYLDINEHSITRCFSGDVLKVLKTIVACLNDGNHDNSDIMTDYFDVGWYIRISIGSFDKPYILQEV